MATQQERSEESAQRLLQAAVELIAEQGFRNTTTAEISRRAGFSNAMVHVRYGSKEALLLELLELYERRLLVDPGPGASSLDAILGQVDAIQRQGREKPAFLLAFCVLVFETVGPLDELRSWLLDWRERYVAHTSAVLRNGQRDGSVREGIDPESEAFAFLDFGTGLCFRWSLSPETVDLVDELDRWRERLRVWLA